MPEETLIAGIGIFKATDGDDRILLLGLTSDGVCGSLGSVLPGYVLLWLHWTVCTADLGGSCSHSLQNTLGILFFFLH